MRALAWLGALCLLAGILATAVVGRAAATAPPRAASPDGAALIARIDHYRALTWRWQRLTGVALTESGQSARRSPDLAYRRWVLNLWRRRAARAERRAGTWLAARIVRYRRVVAHWDLVMNGGAPGLRGMASARTAGVTTAVRLAEYRAWRRRAQAVLARAAHPPNASAWQCIHRYEGAWTDGGAPYYGGLQMDIGFQRRYGGYLLRTKGTADHWTPLEQIWVAARAERSGRGFYPWPNTARLCGLI